VVSASFEVVVVIVDESNRMTQRKPNPQRLRRSAINAAAKSSTPQESYEKVE
jgi:hypothetical protein